jgi:hypothetical protein
MRKHYDCENIDFVIFKDLHVFGTLYTKKPFLDFLSLSLYASVYVHFASI